MKTLLKILGIVSMLALSSCARPNPLGTTDTVSVHSRVPVIAEPARPVLEKPTAEELVEYAKLPESLRTKLESNNTKLQTWAESLHVAIVQYNGYAFYNNNESDQSVGMKPTQK